MPTENEHAALLRKRILLCRVLEVLGVLGIIVLAIVGSSTPLAPSGLHRRLFLAIVMFVIFAGVQEYRMNAKLRTLSKETQ